MSPEIVIIVLPLPPRVLSPNCAVATMRGRFAKAAASKKQRRLAKEAVQAEMVETAPWKKALVSPFFYYKVNRKRDSDNAIGSLKAAYDGIVDAGLILDDIPLYMTRGSPVFSIDKKDPRVVVVIERLE